jgi:hypothetical protein
MPDIFPEFTVVARGKMVQDNYSSGTYVWIRIMVLAAHCVAFNIWEDNYSSRTYLRIRRMTLVAHCGASNICWDNHFYRTYVRIRRMVPISLS